MPSDDIHALGLSPLIAAGDWAALVRYWIAHRYEPALDAAIHAGRRLAEREPRWTELQSFLETVRVDPGDPNIAPPTSLWAIADDASRLSLTVLHLYPRIALCEIAESFPDEHRERAFHIGVEAAREASEAVLAIGDHALGAYFNSMLASGLYRVRLLEQAAEAWATSIELYRQLAIQQREVYSPNLAFTLRNLGNVQRDLIELEAARGSFKDALELFREFAEQRPENYRPLLASTLHDLGNVQRDMKELEAARDCYNEAMELRRELSRQQSEVYGPDFALTLDRLGNVQCDLNELEEARDCYEDALELRRALARQWPGVYSPNLALTLHNLGNVQCDLNEFETARGNYNEALELFRELARQSPEDYCALLASTLHNLGNVERDLNELEAACGSYNEALGLRRELAKQQPEVYWPDMASSLRNLASVQYDLHALEAAHISYKDALELYVELARQQPEDYQPDVAATLNNLGNVQSHSNDLEAALASHEGALKIYRELAGQQPEVYQANLAAVLNNLGNVQGYLNELEAARDSHEEALAIRSELAMERPDVYQCDVATSIRNLGIVEYGLNNMEGALDAFSDALEIVRELAIQGSEVYLPELAISLSNLGCTQAELKDSGAALDSHKEALEIFLQLVRQQPKLYQRDVAMTLSNLGTVQVQMNDLEAARDSYAKALENYRELAVRRPEVHRSDIARTLNNLGTVQQDMNDLGAARESFEEAVTLYESDPMTHLGVGLSERECVWKNLGELHRMGEGLNQPDYRAARDALRRAVDLAEDLRGRLHDRGLRNAMHATILEPYELLVRTCVDLWDTAQDFPALEEAVHVAERCRARGLMERLSEEDLAPRSAPQEQFSEFLRLRHELDAMKLALEIVTLGLHPNVVNRPGHVEIEIARPRLDATGRPTEYLSSLRRLLRASPSLGGLAVSFEEDDPAPSTAPGEAAALVTQAEARLAALVTELRLADPEWEPDRPVIPLVSTEIQALIPTDLATAFVQFTIAADTGLALVLTRESIGCVKLPELSDGACGEAALVWINTYRDRAEHFYEWEDHIDERLSTIGTALHPLWSALESWGVRRAVLSPNGWLHIFPLHACLLADGRRRAGDAFEISYTPSFSILGRCAKRIRAAAGPTLIIGNPTSDLVFTEAEIAAAKCHYSGARVLDHSNATKVAIFADAPSCRLFLYTGHATFETDNPMLSSLILETKDKTQRAKWLSLGDAFCHLNLSQCTLAILNGCESGLLKPDRTDEYLALSSGFLHAGAVCVIGSLWVVHDLSAALLMDRFHAEWCGGKGVAAALREASRWLREDIRNGADLLERVLPEFLRNIPEGIAFHDACMARAQEYAVRAGAHPPFASPAHWAAFAPVGKAW